MPDVSSDDNVQALIDQYEDRINKSNALSFMTNTDGWQILLDTFEEMKDAQLYELSVHNPGDKELVLAAHATWYATVHTLNNLVGGVSAAIRDGETAKIDYANLIKILSQQKEADEEIP